ncbi:DNA-binding protein [Paenibacillus sp. DCT19]|uniref:DNA-binding protein n=1 Tax=Paenibacillus sp. DCT19 TaxID=2211212 RepID=UPI000FE19DA5|nr:DNA-binding protein [Paenibacillus sp. DCT19]
MAISKEQIFTVADTLDSEGINPTLANVRKRLGSGSFSTISEYMAEWREERKDTDASTTREPAPDKINARMEDFGTEIWNMAVEIATARLQAEKDEMLSVQQTLELKQQEIAEMADQMAAEIEVLRQDKSDLDSILLISKENESQLKDSLHEEISKGVHLNDRLHASEELVKYWQQKYEQAQVEASDSLKENTKLQKDLTRAQVVAENKETDSRELKKEIKELNKNLSSQQIDNGKLTGIIESLRAQIAEQAETIKTLTPTSSKSDTKDKK